MKPPLRLCLVRHGETEWSRNGRQTGRTDVVLTGAGRAAAQALGPRLHSHEFARVLVSPLARARQSCEAAGFAGRAEVDDDLAEWDCGDFEGLREADILREHRHWDFWRDGCPGGELPAQVADRALHLLAGLAEAGGDVLLFSHGHFGRLLAMRWIGLSVRQARHFALDTASISWLGHEPGHVTRPAIVLWNATGLALQ